MCDEKKITRWAKEGLNRRQFGVLSGVATMAACVPGQSPITMDTGNSVNRNGTKETEVKFTTADGMLDGFWVTPTDNVGPAVILWPDVAGLRQVKRNMARELASKGYSVLAVNPYYRDRSGEIWESFADFAGNGGWDKAREMRKRLSAAAIMRDANAIVNWLDKQPEVDTARGIGTQGYCMGGPFTMYTAYAIPERIKAAASFHGGGLVSSDPLSPHNLMGKINASLLIAIAQDDDAEQPTHKNVLRNAAITAGRSAKVEVFAGDHGWTVADSPVYSKVEADKAWADLMTLYNDAL